MDRRVRDGELARHNLYLVQCIVWRRVEKAHNWPGHSQSEAAVRLRPSYEASFTCWQVKWTITARPNRRACKRTPKKPLLEEAMVNDPTGGWVGFVLFVYFFSSLFFICRIYRLRRFFPFSFFFGRWSRWFRIWRFQFIGHPLDE